MTLAIKLVTWDFFFINLGIYLNWKKTLTISFLLFWKKVFLNFIGPPQLTKTVRVLCFFAWPQQTHSSLHSILGSNWCLVAEKSQFSDWRGWLRSSPLPLLHLGLKVLYILEILNMVKILCLYSKCKYGLSSRG